MKKDTIDFIVKTLAAYSEDIETSNKDGSLVVFRPRVLANMIRSAHRREINKLLNILDDAGHIVAAFMRRKHGDILVTERGKFVKLINASETLKRIDSVLNQKTKGETK